MQPAVPSSAQSQLTHGMINDVPIPENMLRESHKFMKLVREYNNGEIYDRFKQILDQDYEERSDTGGTMWRMEQLTKDHSKLRQGLKRLRMEAKVTNFIKKIKDRLAIKGLLIYNEILEGFKSGQKSKIKMAEEAGVLFADHEDLFAEFYEFFYS